MNLFENIQKLGKSFYSIRTHEKYFILDLMFPHNWRYEGLYDKEKIAIKINKNSNESFVISLFCLNTKDEVSFLESEVLKIIKINQDEEEKQKLLIQKKEELERLFMSKNLEELKSITFNHKEYVDLPELKETKSDGKHNEESAVVTETDKK
jgi:hypothetical protein